METHEGSADPRAKIQSLIRTAVVVAEEKLGTSIYKHMARTARAPTRAKWEAFRIEQPYCFAKLAGGGWLPTNRIYKPLGIKSRAWVDYEAYAHQAVQLPADPGDLKGVWAKQSDTRLWLYSDDRATLLTYFQRFARLAAVMSPWGVVA